MKVRVRQRKEFVEKIEDKRIHRILSFLSQSPSPTPPPSFLGTWDFSIWSYEAPPSKNSSISLFISFSEEGFAEDAAHIQNYFQKAIAILNDQATAG